MVRYLTACTHLLNGEMTTDHARLLCLDRQTFRRPQHAPQREHSL